MKPLFFFLFFIFSTTTFAQVTIPFTSDKWRFETDGHSVETYLGKEALSLNKNRAFVNFEFENGVIEYDVAFPQARAFIGVMFRVQDDLNYEEFYLRAHQSGNPDANQYTPVYGGVSAWQLYYGEGYGVPVKYQFDTWQHIKLVISGKYMDVYINNMEQPAMFCEFKREPKKGYLGLSDFNSQNYFANLTVTASNNVPLKGSPNPKINPDPGTVLSWDVSNAFEENKLVGVTSLKAIQISGWKKASVEPTGTINLASVLSFTPETNAVLAKVIVNSDKDQIKKFTFGFSDRVKVFCNDKVLYEGADEFTSRDYRFLGTIGYFDSVFLNLKKGNNEVVFAVSENFGGWGLKGKFDDLNGITFVK
jgi:hypothetical protein